MGGLCHLCSVHCVQFHRRVMLRCAHDRRVVVRVALRGGGATAHLKWLQRIRRWGYLWTLHVDV